MLFAKYIIKQEATTVKAITKIKNNLKRFQ